jgi:hypothetical protein
MTCCIVFPAASVLDRDAAAELGRAVRQGCERSCGGRGIRARPSGPRCSALWRRPKRPALADDRRRDLTPIRASIAAQTSAAAEVVDGSPSLRPGEPRAHVRLGAPNGKPCFPVGGRASQWTRVAFQPCGSLDVDDGSSPAATRDHRLRPPVDEPIGRHRNFDCRVEPWAGRMDAVPPTWPRSSVVPQRSARPGSH